MDMEQELATARRERNETSRAAEAMKALAEKVEAERDKLATLVRDLTDPEPCWFDHHGGCQAHGYLGLEPTERCPHAEAKEVLAAMGIELEA